MKNFTKKNIIIAFILIAFAVSVRMLIHGYNVEPIMAVSILAGVLLGPELGFTVALFSVIGTDVLIGNTTILFYTWSAWAIIGAASAVLKHNNNRTIQVWSETLKLTGMGLVGTLFFYLWTNFGVWHIGGLYPHTWVGLMDSYINALPFLRNQVLGNLVIVPGLSVIVLSVLKYFPAFSTQPALKKVLS